MINVYLEKDLFLYTKTITVSPRFIILNKTKHTLLAKKANNIFGEFEIFPDIRMPFIWKNLESANIAEDFINEK